ncbi:MAG: Plug domain-containing protein, partial [Acidobacteriota bacterium]|nr:Plug domain-containing protein [Acidobacteriota bacterium]
MKQLVLLFILQCAAWAQQAAQNPATPSTLHREEQVVVTGSYPAIPMEEADRSVDTLPVGQSPVNFRSFVDVLQQDPALDVQQRVPGMQGDISIRGASYEETLILLNGLRLNDAQTGHNNLDIPFPFASLERIEVMKGAG